MLTLVAYDALQNVDIAKRYPAFYKRLLANPTLRTQFLEIVTILELETEPLSELDSQPVDLTFLDKIPLQPIFSHTIDGAWNIVFHIPSQRIDQRFNAAFESAPEAETQRGLGLDLSNREIYLFDEEIEVNGTLRRVRLQVSIDPEKADQYGLALLIDTQPTEHFSPPLIASITWGPYAVERRISQGRQHHLPPIVAAELDVPDGPVAPLTITLSQQP